MIAAVRGVEQLPPAAGGGAGVWGDGVPLVSPPHDIMTSVVAIAAIARVACLEPVTGSIVGNYTRPMSAVRGASGRCV